MLSLSLWRWGHTVTSCWKSQVLIPPSGNPKASGKRASLLLVSRFQNLLPIPMPHSHISRIRIRYLATSIDLLD